MPNEQDQPKTKGWAQQLREILTETQTLLEKMHQLRAVLPPEQASMTVRIQEFEDTIGNFLSDEVVQRLFK